MNSDEEVKRIWDEIKEVSGHETNEEAYKGLEPLITLYNRGKSLEELTAPDLKRVLSTLQLMDGFMRGKTPEELGLETVTFLPGSDEPNFDKDEGLTFH